MNNYPFRKHVRLSSDNYFGGYYFVTIIVFDRRPILNGSAAKSLRDILTEIPYRFPGWSIDTYEIMPDHAHLILVADKASVHLGRVVGTIKSLFVKWCHTNFLVGEIWQRNYYERIIRSNRELADTRRYVMANPWVTEINWQRVPELVLKSLNQ